MPPIDRRIIDSITGKLPVARLRLWVFLGLFLVSGAILLKYSIPYRHFSEETLIYDAIWLDAWSLGFVLALALIWVSDLRWKTKAWLGIFTLAFFGCVELAVIFDGTPFSSYAYWGDQKFRIAMVLKFMKIGWFTDFYYKDLPLFYPPLLYWCFAAMGKVLSVSAFHTLKLGGMAIYLFGPPLSYLLWRRLVEPLSAWLIVLFTFLTCSFPTPYMLSAPHAFVSITIFIPWWLHYVEGVGLYRPSFKDYLIGSLIGAVIAATYYYPFFVVATVLVLRALWMKHRDHFRWHRAIVVLGGSFILSSWFWLPVLLSAVEYGFDGAQGRWHHSDSTGVRLLYMVVSYKGILFLAGLLFLLARLKKPLHRSLLLLIGSIIPLVALGSVLGALDHPINLIKAREMVWVMAGPAIGLMAAYFIRRWRRTTMKWVAPVLAGVAVIVFVHQFDGYIKSKLVQTARTAYVPTWNTDKDEMAGRNGTVFLCGHEEFASFYPVYYFIVPNEHYSNPTSRIKMRFDMLDILERVQDPYLTNLALRTNRYDPVDYVMPRWKDSCYEFPLGLSNYPDRYSSRTFRFNADVFSNPELFKPETGDHLFGVLAPEHLPSEATAFWPEQNADSLVTMMWLALLRDHLNEKGKAALDEYTGADWSGWQRLIGPGESVELNDTIGVKDLRMVPSGDSLHFLFAMETSEPMRRRLTAALRLSGSDTDDHDFVVVPLTNTWKEWHTVVFHKAVPRTADKFHISFWLYDRLGALPGKVNRDCRLIK